jgi:hypothetical protein
MVLAKLTRAFRRLDYSAGRIDSASLRELCVLVELCKKWGAKGFALFSRWTRRL